MNSPARSALLVAILALGACGDDANTAPDARPLPPDADAYLPTASYDCRATGPFTAPARPHSLDCYADLDCDSPLITGHRIANPFAPENTLSALRAAILLGVDIVETDIRLSSDGVVVFIHDDTVDRTTRSNGLVQSLTAAQLQELEIEFETGDPDGDFGCDTIPTIDEIFALSRDQIVVELEIKDSNAGVVAAEYLRDNGLYGQSFLLCDPAECAAARAAVPDVPIMSRPGDPDEVAAEIAYDPPPEIVHIDAISTFLTADVVGQIHGVGAKVFANGFIRGDGPALGSGDYSGYLQLFEDGLDVIQAEFPHLGLQALGRIEQPETQ
jgi:glycerophosphoryl diester phosphodiesterase